MSLLSYSVGIALNFNGFGPDFFLAKEYHNLRFDMQINLFKYSNMLMETQENKREDLKRSPGLLNNVKICQGQLWLFI